MRLIFMVINYRRRGDTCLSLRKHVDLGAKVTLPADPSSVKEGLVATARISQKSIPADQLNRTTKAIPGLVDTTPAICGSLPAIGPLIKFTDDIGNNEAVEHGAVIEFDWPPFDIGHAPGLETADIALDLELRILVIGVGRASRAFEFDEKHLGRLLDLPQSVDIVEDKDIRPFIAFNRFRKLIELLV